MEPKFIQSKKMDGGQGKDSKKEKIQIIVLVCLAVFFVFIVYKTFFTGKKSVSAVAKKESPKIVTKVTPTSSAPSTTGEHGENADEWGFSPFSLKPVTKDKAGETSPTFLQLKGIVFDGNAANSYAIINENIVKKGDPIADNIVKDIFPDHVVLEDKEGHTFTLHN